MRRVGVGGGAPRRGGSAHAGDLGDVTQVVRSPRRQQLAGRHPAQLRVHSPGTEVDPIVEQAPEFLEIDRPQGLELVEKILERRGYDLNREQLHDVRARVKDAADREKSIEEEDVVAFSTLEGVALQ